MQLTGKFLSALLTVSILICCIPITGVLASENDTPQPETTESIHEGDGNPNHRTGRSKDIDKGARDAYSPQAYGWSATVGNEFLEFVVEEYGDNSGKFTIGTTGGNPNSSQDQYQNLLYGHPNPWSSFTSVRIDGMDYVFEADEVEYSTADRRVDSTMQVEGVLVKQTLQIVMNDATGFKDTVRISYSATNLNNTPKIVGFRIMLDTMLGYNDGAPFKVPSLGNVTTEEQLAGKAVPQSWQAFDSLWDPSVFAVGTLYKGDDRKPDKIQFADWSYISDTLWDYETTPNHSITGDSAVAIYWNPIQLPGQSSTSVSTYYGVGFASTGGGAELGTAVIPTTGFGLLALDNERNPLQGVNVRSADGLWKGTTDVQGRIVFDSFPQGGQSTTLNFTLTKTGYQALSVPRVVTRGAQALIIMQEESETPSINSVILKRGVQETDLMNDAVNFKEDVEGTSLNDYNHDEVKVTIHSSHSDRVVKYQFIQEGRTILQSSNPTFTLYAINGSASNEYAVTGNTRITNFKAGKSIYAQILDGTGKVIDKQKINLVVSKPNSFSESGFEELSYDAGDKLKINIPSGVPFLGNSTIKLGWEKAFPLDIKIDDKGKVRVALNKSGDTSWGDFEENFKAFKRSGAAKAFGGKADPFAAGQLKFKGNVMGFGEGYVDSYGDVIVDLGILFRIEEEGHYTYTFPLVYCPVYISIGQKLSLSTEGKATLVVGDGKIKSKSGTIIFNPKFTLNADGGIGANRVLNVGVSGRGTIDWLNRFSSQDGNYNLVTLNGELFLVATAFLFEFEKSFANKTWTLYDSDAKSSLQSNSPTGFNLYDSSAFELMGRDYLTNQRKRLFHSSEDSTVFSNVFPNAMPKMVEVDGQPYVFWLQDIVTRSDENRTALVYSTMNPLDNYWEPPVQLLEEQPGSTADFDFDLSVDGSDIHIVWSKANQQFPQGVTLEEMARELEIYTLTLDTVYKEVKSMTPWTADHALDAMPRISSDGTYIAWLSTELPEGQGLFEANNSTIKYRALNAPVGTPHSVFEVEQGAIVTDLAVGKIGENAYIAYVKDFDGDLNTNEDKEIILIPIDGEMTDEVKLTDNDVIDSNPIFVSHGGNDSLFWFSDGNILYTNDLTHDQAVFDEVCPVNLNDGFIVLSDGMDNTRIIWEADSGEDASYQPTSALFAVNWSDGAWSQSYKLQDTFSEMTSEISGFLKNENIHLVYLHTTGTGIEGMYPYRDIRVMEIEPWCDIALNGLFYDYEDAVPGAHLPLTVLVQNTGAQPIQEFNICYGDESFAIISDANLLPGTQKEFTVDGFVIPQGMNSPEEFEFYLRMETTASPGYPIYSEYYPVVIGHADLELSSSLVLANGRSIASITVANQSGFDTSAVLRITADEFDGAVLYENSINRIEAGEAQSFLIDLDSLTFGAPISHFHIFVDAGLNDPYPENNRDAICFVPAEEMYILNVETSTGGFVLGVTGGMFYAEDVIPISTVAEMGYGFDKWTTDNGGSFASETQESTTFIMPHNNVTVSATFSPLETGWHTNASGYLYYVIDVATVALGWHQIDGAWYYFDPFTGIMSTGWVHDGNKRYYLASNGVMQTGWIQDEGQWYYLAPGGAMQTGWVNLSGKWYYLDSHGVMQTGWVKLGGKWYYLVSSGAMQTGWVKVSGKWYYLDSHGVMQTGWVKLSGKWYCLDSHGVMQTGWFKENSYWYYFSSGGAMQVGWVKVEKNWYYFYDSGKMARNTTIDGYYLGSSGAMQ